MYQLEPEAAGEFERAMMSRVQNAGGPAETGQNQSGQPLRSFAAKAILPF